MKACIYINCPDRYISGNSYDNFCPRCGKKLYDTSDEKVEKLIKIGYYKQT